MIQTSAEPQHLRDPAPAGLLERLRTSGYPALRLLPDAMEADAYRALFRGAIVLQPHDAATFADRVSGVTLDALAAGAPVITTAGTWMARLVAQDGTGIATDDLGPGTPEALDAILDDASGTLRAPHRHPRHGCAPSTRRAR